MNRILLLTFAVLAIISTPVQAQVSIPSTNGYSVNISITPVAIVPSTTNCTWGYNYNVTMQYSVTFTGSNQPASLYTLQGTLGCGTSGHFFDLPNGQGSGTVTSQSNVWNPSSTCNTATVSSLNCNEVTIEIGGPGISNRTITFPASAALPVTLVDFSAQATRTSVLLNWATETEINNDHFSIERSADGRTWTSIGEVAGAGNTNARKEYSFTDRQPLTSAYYRLKQVDLDGSFEYSKVQFTRSNPASGTVSVFPVPNTGQTIQFAGLTDFSSLNLVVLNAGGKSVFTGRIQSNTVTLPKLEAGIYVLQIRNQNSGEVNNLRYVQL